MKRMPWLVLMFLAAFKAVWGEDAAPAATPPVDSWKKQVVASLNLNQGAFSDWQQGGTNFISWQAAFNARLENDNAASNWLNTLKLEYGLTYIDGQGTRKSADNLDLESVFAWKTWPQVNPFVSFSAKSQFDAGFDYSQDPAVQTSAFLDPGYFTETAGLKYVPGPEFNTRLGLAVKETVADKFQAIYTVDPDTGKLQGVLTELGAGWVSELNLKFSEDSKFGSKLDLFWNGKGLDRTVAEWDNLLSIGLNKVLSVNIENDYRYDPKVYLGWQIKETVGLGFAYNLL
ncbi:MAG TPA: DUF3078 domain-containing protein [bacterium]|nr:DUF3078 domain-containing protein [bacterium]